ncbi:MAG: signal peptidase II, partial [Chloroflexi bacterium]
MNTGRALFVVVAAVVFALDRVTKSLVSADVPYGTEVSAIGRFVGITNVRNSGAAFGFAPAGATIFLVA